MYKVITLILAFFYLSAEVAASSNNLPGSKSPQDMIATEVNKSLNNSKSSAINIKETAEPLKITDAWARPSMVAGGNSAIYMTIENTSSQEYNIIGASAITIANSVEMHSTYKDPEGVTRMSSINKILIPVKTKVMLSPGGMHIMLLNLKQNLTQGQKFQLNLSFEDGSSQVVEVVVKQDGSR